MPAMVSGARVWGQASRAHQSRAHPAGERQKPAPRWWTPGQVGATIPAAGQGLAGGFLKSLIRIAAGILLALCLAILCLMLFGLRGNAGVMESEVDIHRPATVIYPYLTEPDSLKRWVGGLVSDSVLTDGGLRVGERLREVMDSHGERYVLDCLVTGMERDHRLDLLVTHPRLKQAQTKWESLKKG